MLPASELLAISRACPRNLARELARSLCRWSKSVCQARSGEVRVPTLRPDIARRRNSN